MFNLVSVDGYFSGQNGDISWHKTDDEEFHALATRNVTSGRTLIFGRVTYDLMERFWSTPEAKRLDPVIANAMNESKKILVSRSRETPRWKGTTLITGELIEGIRSLKKQTGNGLCILGSGQLVAQLAQANLIDEYELLVVPVAIGTGHTLFEGIKEPLNLKLVGNKAFRNGSMLLTYVPA